MITGREELVVLEKAAKLQRQIYPDAADFGIEINEQNKHVVAEVKAALSSLKEMFSSSVKVSHWGDTKLGGWTCEVFIPIEYDEGRVVGQIVSVGYNAVHRTRFIDINFKRASRAR